MTHIIFLDVTQNFDCVFWCGDLNFRLAQPREEVIQWVTDTCFPQQSPVNLHKDQLRTILNEGAVLRGFEEAPIMFPPTYKYDPGTQNFDSSSKQRTPAYTDRILFKGKGHTRGYIRRVSHESTNSYKDGVIECLVYDSVPSICTSDRSQTCMGCFQNNRKARYRHVRIYRSCDFNVRQIYYICS